MSQQVWRFPIPMTSGSLFAIMAPKGARVVHVAVQQRAPGAPTMWMQLDPGAPIARHEFVLVDTGQTIPEGFEHVGTFQQHGFVEHLYKRKEKLEWATTRESTPTTT